MDNCIFPLDPADSRPDLLLWSGWPQRPTHLTTATEPTPTPVDMLECFCGTHVWIAADGRRWEYGAPAVLHRCPPVETPLEAAERAFRGHFFSDPEATSAGPQETLAPLDDFVIE